MNKAGELFKPYNKKAFDGEYIVSLGNNTYPVNVINGSGNVSVSNLTVGSYVVITIVNITNYFAFNETEFGETP